MHAIVFGASGGIGTALVSCLVERSDVETVHAVSRQNIVTWDKLTSYQADILDDHQLSELSQTIASKTKPALIIVATGLLSDGSKLQPEKTYRQQSLENFERVFRVNTFAPALVAKHFLPIMPRKGRSVFGVISARVGSISDNRSGGWHAYRASKAALNMLVRNYAIEQRLKNKQSIIVGLHPGTVDTDLSKPFQKNLPEGQIISPETSATSMLRVIDGLDAKDTGKVFDWRGDEVRP